MIDHLAAALIAPLLLLQGDQPTAKSLLVDTFEELAQSQRKDGRWKTPRKTPEKLTDAGVTGLGVLLFVGGGHFPKHGKYHENVSKALAYLQKKLGKSGRVKGSFSNQALVTHALVEVYSVSRDESLKASAERAIGGLLAVQNEDGSFGDSRSGGIHQTTLGFLALKSAKVAGLEVKGDALKRAAGALTSAIDPTSLTAKGDQSPLDRHGSLAAVYVGVSGLGPTRPRAFRSVLRMRSGRPSIRRAIPEMPSS